MSGQNYSPLPGQTFIPHTLLHWQFILLFVALGTLFLFSNLWSLLAACLLGVAYFLKSPPSFAPAGNKPFKQAQSLVVFALAFGLGVMLAHFAYPTYPANFPALQAAFATHKKALSITATVQQVDSMPDAKLRIVLQDMEIELPNELSTGLAQNLANGLNNSTLINALDEATKNNATLANSTSPKIITGIAEGIITNSTLVKSSAASPSQQVLGKQNLAHEKPPASTILKLPGNLAWTWKFPTNQPLPGQRISVFLRINPIHGMFNPGIFNIEDYWMEKNIAWRAWSDGEKANYQLLDGASFWQNARATLHTKLSAALKNEQGQISGGKAVIMALLMGDRYYLTNQDMELFAAASLSHSLALSGLHLGLMAALGASLAFLVCSLRPSIMLYIPRPKLIVLFSAPLVLFYLWLGGITPSLTRAALMFACWGVLLLRGRQHILMDGLFWAILLILIINPLALHDIRLQLSAVSVAAIALCLPASLVWAKKICTRPSRCGAPNRCGRLAKVLQGAISLLIISASIQLALLPIQVENFGLATPWFVLNLIWLPVLSTFVFPLAVIGLGLCLISPLQFVSRWVFDLAALPVDALFALLSKLDKLDLLIAPAVARPLPAASLAYWTLFLLLAAMLAKYANHKNTEQLHASTQPVINPTLSSLKTSNSFLFSLKKTWSQFIAPYTANPNFSGPKLSAPMLALLFCAWGLVTFCLWERWQAENPANPRLRLLDVGQGQAVLIEGANGARVLIDGGGLPGSSFDVGKNIISPILTLNRPPRLSAAINSHPDNDHLGGMIYIFKKFKIEHIYLGQGLPEGKQGEELELLLRSRGFGADLDAPPLRAGQYVNLDQKHKLQVLHPAKAKLAKTDPASADPASAETASAETASVYPKGKNNIGKPLSASSINDAPDNPKEVNNQSLVLRLIRSLPGEALPERGLALSCGDIYLPGINEILALNSGHSSNPQFKNNQLSSQVLILPHHGSQKSFNPNFYELVKPDIALVSTGFNNPWGFPSQEVKNELSLRHIPLYNTAQLGQIIIEWNENYQATVSWGRKQ